MSGIRGLNVQVSGPGSKTIMAGLGGWRLTDAEGLGSDELRLTVTVDPSAGLPPEGAEIEFSYGVPDLYRLGRFKIRDVIRRLGLPEVEVVCTAAAFTVADPTAFKLRRTRTFEGVTLGALVSEVMEPHGYDVVVDPELAGRQVDHVTQDNEKDSSFLKRLARDYDAVAKPTDGKYVFALKGRVKAMSGVDLPELSVNVGGPGDLHFVEGTASPVQGRKSYTGAKGRYYDPEAAKEVEHSVGRAPFVVVRQVQSSQSALEERLQAALRKAQREGYRLRLRLHGDPRLVAEGRLVLGGDVASDIAGAWSIDQVTHSCESGVVFCDVEATRPAS